jgi:two-component system sensor histidine kinase TctE
MTPAKDEIVENIKAAKAELEMALERLHSLPMPAAGTIQMTAYAIRSYLQIARGTTVLLQQELAEYPIRNVHVWLEALKRADDLMTQALEDIQPSAKPPPDRIHWEEVDLGRMVMRFCEHFQRTPSDVMVEPEIEAVSPNAWTDRIMIAAIVYSLLMNAVKYSPPGKRVLVRLEDGEDGVVCMVRDEGPPLSPEERAIFESTVRLPGNRSTDMGDGAYGLVVAKQLADRLGIKIWPFDEPTGCCIAFSAPRPDDEKLAGRAN